MKACILFALGSALVVGALVLLFTLAAEQERTETAARCAARWADSGLPARYAARTCQVQVRGRWLPESNIQVPASAAQ